MYCMGEAVFSCIEEADCMEEAAKLVTIRKQGKMWIIEDEKELYRTTRKNLAEDVRSNFIYAKARKLMRKQAV